jgi:hypothetical protein
MHNNNKINSTQVNDPNIDLSYPNKQVHKNKIQKCDRVNKMIDRFKHRVNS